MSSTAMKRLAELERQLSAFTEDRDGRCPACPEGPGTVYASDGPEPCPACGNEWWDVLIELGGAAPGRPMVEVLEA